MGITDLSRGHLIELAENLVALRLQEKTVLTSELFVIASEAWQSLSKQDCFGH